jgi:hypothetical protein
VTIDDVPNMPFDALRPAPIHIMKPLIFLAGALPSQPVDPERGDCARDRRRMAAQTCVCTVGRWTCRTVRKSSFTCSVLVGILVREKAGAVLHREDRPKKVPDVDLPPSLQQQHGDTILIIISSSREEWSLAPSAWQHFDSPSHRHTTACLWPPPPPPYFHVLFLAFRSTVHYM